MQPTRILIASVLKPVDDIRMSQKIGLSLARKAGLEVHVAGHCTRHKAALELLHLHPLFCFGRLSWKRAAANYHLLRLAWKLRPRLLMVGTHELLPAALLLKLLLRLKVVYDVRENYYRNIRYTTAFPWLVRWPLAGLVRLVEYFSRFFVNQYLLAENTYRQELPLPAGKTTVIENKHLQQPGSKQLPEKELPVTLRHNKEINLLYTGTIASTYGIFEALALAEKLHAIDSRFSLTIIGFAPQQQVLQQVRQQINGKSYIRLLGGESPVPHRQILDETARADVGLLPYRPNPSTWGCIPTKLYEYLAHGLPMLVQQNPAWHSLLQQWHAGISIDFATIEADNLYNLLLGSTFYTTGKPTGISWETEEEKLLRVVKGLI